MPCRSRDLLFGGANLSKSILIKAYECLRCSKSFRFVELDSSNLVILFRRQEEMNETDCYVIVFVVITYFGTTTRGIRSD